MFYNNTSVFIKPDTTLYVLFNVYRTDTTLSRTQCLQCIIPDTTQSVFLIGQIQLSLELNVYNVSFQIQHNLYFLLHRYKLSGLYALNTRNNVHV